jgi:hypothetical protein
MYIKIQPIYNSHPFVPNNDRWNFTPNLIGTNFHFSLRGRLTLGSTPFPRKPRTFGNNDFSTLFIATHVSILNPTISMPSFNNTSIRLVGHSVTTFFKFKTSANFLSPIHYRNTIQMATTMSFYAFFKGWLPPSPPLITAFRILCISYPLKKFKRL